MVTWLRIGIMPSNQESISYHQPSMHTKLFNYKSLIHIIEACFSFSLNKCKLTSTTRQNKKSIHKILNNYLVQIFKRIICQYAIYLSTLFLLLLWTRVVVKMHYDFIGQKGDPYINTSISFPLKQNNFHKVRKVNYHKWLMCLQINCFVLKSE